MFIFYHSIFHLWIEFRKFIHSQLQIAIFLQTRSRSKFAFPGISSLLGLLGPIIQSLITPECKICSSIWKMAVSYLPYLGDYWADASARPRSSRKLRDPVSWPCQAPRCKFPSSVKASRPAKRRPRLRVPLLWNRGYVPPTNPKSILRTVNDPLELFFIFFV